MKSCSLCDISCRIGTKRMIYHKTRVRLITSHAHESFREESIDSHKLIFSCTRCVMAQSTSFRRFGRIGSNVWLKKNRDTKTTCIVSMSLYVPSSKLCAVAERAGQFVDGGFPAVQDSPRENAAGSPGCSEHPKLSRGRWPRLRRSR